MSSMFVRCTGLVKGTTTSLICLAGEPMPLSALAFPLPGLTDTPLLRLSVGLLYFQSPLTTRPRCCAWTVPTPDATRNPIGTSF